MSVVGNRTDSAGEMTRLLKRVDLRPPATDAAIIKCVEYLGGDLPEDYEQFLRMSDGGEGSVGSSYAAIWDVENLIAGNTRLNVREYNPDLVVFGSEGGEGAFCFDKRTKPWKVVMVPFIGLSWDDAVPMGNSFSEFLQRLRSGIWTSPGERP